MNKGITLIELLVTIAIFSILVTLTTPLALNYLRDMRLKKAANIFFTNMQLYRSEAIKRSITVDVNLSPGGGWCYGFSDAGTCNCQASNGCLYSGTENSIKPKSGENVRMSLLGATPNDFAFSGDQGMSSSNIDVAFSNGAHSISILISALGRIRICSDSMAGYQPC